MKKIYVKEWMLFQPYERQDEVECKRCQSDSCMFKGFCWRTLSRTFSAWNCHLFDALVSGCDFTDRNLASIL